MVILDVFYLREGGGGGQNKSMIGECKIILAPKSCDFDTISLENLLVLIHWKNGYRFRFNIFFLFLLFCFA